MRTHREFFQDTVDPMADIVFVGCSVTNAAEPLSPSGGGTAPRRQVILDGRRVKTVDVHAHCAVPEAMALMGMKVPTLTKAEAIWSSCLSPDPVKIVTVSSPVENSSAAC
jgi:hypothetical protein